MYTYTTVVINSNGKVVREVVDHSGNAAMDTLKWLRKEYPASKGYTVKEV